MDDKTYAEFIIPYTYAMKLIVTHLENVQSELISSPTIRNPIDSVYGRIKTRESLNEKCRKDKYNIDPDNLEEIHQKIRDIAGIRITCVYRKDLIRVREYIEKIPGVFILEEKDYTTNPKPSGYQSLHLIVLIETCTLTNGFLKIPVEVQIRTLNMQSWAQVEHRARYKSENSKTIPNDLDEKIQKAARLAAELDSLYDEILTASGEN